MKKILALIIVLVQGSVAFSQTQRLVLAEEFTQASCPPCATHNPPYHALLDANPTKIIGLTYQVNWPGTDPMNLENPTQVATRVTYYGVSGVPHGIIDGSDIVNDCGYWTGAPLCLSQADINAAYAVPSPFTLTASHTISADYDSIFITVEIAAVQALTATSSLRAHVAIIEREIHFTSAPGNNGETDFPWVMRRMLPGPTGTTLASSWTNGQTQTLTFASPLPWYLRNVNQIGVVAFIQESNATKTVHQAAYSAPLAPVPAVNDASITVLTVPLVSCNPVNATVALRNAGTATLTSAVIEYQFDAVTNWFYNLSDSYAWSGSLAPGGVLMVNLPPATLTPGQHKLSVNVTMPNGNIDLNPNNSIKHSTNFLVFSNSGTSTPVMQGFESATFPPADWVLNNPAEVATWTRFPNVGGFGNSATSARMYFYTSASGQVDELFLPTADMQWVQPGITLTFSVAYAQKTTQNDRLQVMVSTNCGQSWAIVYDESGTSLSTHAPYNSGLWVPTAADWRADTVNLDSYAGNGNVLIKFKAISANGNNLYLDDVNLQFVTGINQPDISNEVDVYPNPSDGIINLNLDFDGTHNVTVNVYNSLGELVAAKDIGSTSGGLYTMNLSTLASGNYVVQVLSEKGSTLRKITINK